MYLIRKIYHLIVDNKITTLAGSITFFLVLNGGSFLFLYIVLSSYLPHFFIDVFLNEFEEGSLKDFISYFFMYQNNLSYSIFLVVTSVYSASSLYYHLMHISELVCNIKLKLTLSKRISAIILTLLFTIIMHIISFTSAYIMINFKRFYLLILFGTLLLIFLLMIYVINMTALHTIKFKKIYKGFIFTILYFLIFTIGFIIYLKIFSNFKVVYGVLSFLIILMFYLYILAIGLVIGIYINCKNLDVWDFLTSRE